MMNHYNQVGVQKWSDLIAYGISRDEFNTVEIDEIVNVILYAYQGIRMWSRIVKMSPVVFDSITNYIRKQLVKEYVQGRGGRRNRHPCPEPEGQRHR